MPNYSENIDSQQPALELFQKMGYIFLSQKEAEQERDKLLQNVLLDNILTQQLQKINSFEYKGEEREFSTNTIQSAVNVLKTMRNEGLVNTNEKIYDLLTLGKSFSETVQGDQKSYTLRYIDWDNPENNSYHVTEEFTVEGPNATCRPDIILFINGIPIVIIENKCRDKNESLDEAISQHIRNQRNDAGIPRLFHFAQLLIAVQPNEVKYAVTNTAKEFWSTWRETNEERVQDLIPNRLPTEQDRVLYALCEKERLLELIYTYLVYDRPFKKIARYQQYFAVKSAIERVKQITPEGTRKGGVVWHTQGSGKSLTMVILSKALALEPTIKTPRVIIVTDRISLDKQISKTFYNCGKNVEKARSGNHLVELLKDNGIEVITTVIDKFDTALKNHNYKSLSKDIFVLIDESHRSQYGSANAKMKTMLPNACFIGFTGTPLMSKDKNTARKFGGYIHKYTIDQAIKDEAVLPLIYEGRSTKLDVLDKKLDEGFEDIVAGLSDDAAHFIKKKVNSISRVFEAQEVIETIAKDIAKHYSENWQGKGFKAQLAVPKIETAIRYQKYFEGILNPKHKVNTAVVFTPPDSRAEYENTWDAPNSEARKYWDKLMESYGSQEEYEKDRIDKFKDPKNTDVEIIIVVSKLLTGFDAPCNTVLYLAKPLIAHNLLQAIARVNRLYEGKDHGYVVDYVGLLGKLDEALTTYSALEDFDEDDLTSALVDVDELLENVQQSLAQVWNIFKGVNKNDTEALERHLDPKDVRDQFYDAVTTYAKDLQAAMSTDAFYTKFTDQQAGKFLGELKTLAKMKVSVQNRFAERVSYKEYEQRIQKLLDRYVQSDGMETIVDQVDIFNSSHVAEALEVYGKTPASKADMIANNMKKVIQVNLEKDITYYKSFAELIEETIKEYRDGRMSEKAYLGKVLEIRDDFEKGYTDDTPDSMKHYPEARAVYGIVKKHFGENYIHFELEQLGLRITEAIESNTIVDWKRNPDVKKDITNTLEDLLIAYYKDHEIDINWQELTSLLEVLLNTAESNY